MKRVEFLEILACLANESHTWHSNMVRRKRKVTLTKQLRSETAQERHDSDRKSWPTAEERLAAVWELTLASLAWGNSGNGEPRLQRSICNIQR